jgi:hypothetical protein
MQDLDDVIDCLQAHHGPEGAFAKVCQFMLAYLSLISYPLPPVARSGISVATDFFSGNASAADLESARLACWAYLDGKNASSDISTPEICAVRAAICCMHAVPEDDDLFDLLSWFLELANKVEDHTAEVPSLIEKFLHCPPRPF